MRLLGRGWQESLIGAYEKPPAMPEDIYLPVNAATSQGVKKIELWQIAIYDNENGYPYDAVCKMSQPV